MSADQTIVLVTGANSGLGFAIALQLIADPTKHVLLACRSVEKGEAALKDLQSQNSAGTVELLHLDVANEESVTAAAQQVESKYGRLDALVNNAAIGWPGGSPAEAMMKSYETNAVGPYLTVEAFAPLMKQSNGTPRIINVTSGAGSVPRRLDPEGPGYNLGMKGIQYGASKAGMNLITAYQAVVYGEQGIKVFAYSPGFVISNLGPHNNAENGALPASVGALPLVDIVNGKRDDELPRDGFLRVKGQSPW